MTEESRQFLLEVRDFIADFCDENDIALPVELIHQISMALGESYE
jgi:hypothetical protein